LSVPVLTEIQNIFYCVWNSFLSGILLSKKYLGTRNSQSSFRRPKAHLRPAFLRWKFYYMATSRFVCGEISRLIKQLHAVLRNAHPRETRVKKPPRKHVSQMNASSVFTRPLLSYLLPCYPFISHSSRSPTLTPLSSSMFLPYQYNTWTRSDKKKKRKQRCRAWRAREISDHVD